MKAAIYARKSTDDSDKATGDKSVTRQVAHAQVDLAAIHVGEVSEHHNDWGSV